MILLHRFIFPLTLFIFCFLFLFRDSYHASSLEVVPDSVEYTAIAKNLLTTGSSKIEVDEALHPSRYTPWFSITVLCPALLIFGSEPGNAIYGVFFFSVCCLICIYFLFCRLVNPYAALAGTLSFLLLPEYILYSKFVMNDSLSGLIFVIALLGYLAFGKNLFKNRILAFSFGAIFSLAYLWRVTNLAVFGPIFFLMIKEKRDLSGKLIFLFPLFLAFIINSYYSYDTFNSFFRNGYNYWVSVPYDYLSLTFKWAYFQRNLEVLINQWGWLPLLFASSILVHLWKERNIANKILCFYFFALLPVLVFYLIYFFFHIRFYLPIYLTLIATSVLMLRYLPKYCSLIFLCLILGNLIWKADFNKNYPPSRRLNIQQINNFTSNDAIVLTNLDDVYLNLFFDDSERRFIPISRYSEYANKIITTSKHPSLSAKEIAGPVPHRHPELLKLGKEPYRYVFLEDPERLKPLLKKRPVYLDLFLVNTEIAKSYLTTILFYYDLRIVAEGIYLITEKSKLPTAQTG